MCPPPDPLRQVQRTVILPLFDSAYYLACHPDVAALGADPVDHYLSTGWKEGRNPAPEFCEDYYRQHNADVAQWGLPGLLHYALVGKGEGRKTEPPTQATPGLRAHVNVLKPHFDSAFYLARYWDVARMDLDPIHHYLNRGWREERDPSPDFSTSYYLKTNPDIVERGINPFLHYITEGCAEGRLPRRPQA